METEKILELEKIPVVSSPSNTGYILTTLGRYPISFFVDLLPLIIAALVTVT